MSVINEDDVQYILFYEPKGKYGSFTNFFKLKRPLVIDGELFINTEQYYQVIKFRGPDATPRMVEYSNIIKSSDSPMKAKMLGHQKKNTYRGKKWVVNKKTDNRIVNDVIDEYKDINYRENWNYIGKITMVRAVYAKFSQFPELRELLTSIPDNGYIVEHTTRDKIWADGGDGGSGKIGKNQLGKILTGVSYFLKYGNCDNMSDKLKDIIKIN